MGDRVFGVARDRFEHERCCIVVVGEFDATLIAEDKEAIDRLVGGIAPHTRDEHT